MGFKGVFIARTCFPDVPNPSNVNDQEAMGSLNLGLNYSVYEGKYEDSLFYAHLKFYLLPKYKCIFHGSTFLIGELVFHVF